jgi:hypothetical protein
MRKTFGKKVLLGMQSLVFILAFCLGDGYTSTNKEILVFGQTGSDKINLKVEDLSTTRSSTGLAEVKGKIVNNGTSSVHNVKIDTAFFDKDGNTLGKFSKYATPPSFVLNPGDSHNFDFFEVVSFHRISQTNVTSTADAMR